MPPPFVWEHVEDWPYDGTVSRTTRYLANAYLTEKGIIDNISMAGAYGHCIEHEGCNFVFKFSRKDNNTLCVQKQNQHTPQITLEMRVERNKSKYGHLKPAQAMLEMTKDGIPEDEQPTESDIKHYRYLHRSDSQRVPHGRTIFSFNQWLNQLRTKEWQGSNPGISVDMENKIVEDDKVLVSLCSECTISHAARLWEEGVEFN